ncbi:hypothetical protein [Janibacter melonis]|uniref:hypothetical protein n=1 Tax=Janibacter melonis TaxID=262209 RepID=UPI002095D4C1|nr:hypothetical protein [Janibacter melonis]
MSRGVADGEGVEVLDDELLDGALLEEPVLLGDVLLGEVPLVDVLPDDGLVDDALGAVVDRPVEVWLAGPPASLVPPPAQAPSPSTRPATSAADPVARRRSPFALPTITITCPDRPRARSWCGGAPCAPPHP